MWAVGKGCIRSDDRYGTIVRLSGFCRGLSRPGVRREAVVVASEVLAGLVGRWIALAVANDATVVTIESAVGLTSLERMKELAKGIHGLLFS